jgi:hypothetical protein
MAELREGVGGRACFAYRLVSGWISDYSSVPRWEPWPSITLDGRLMADLSETFAIAQLAGYNGVILWGLLCGRSWRPFLPDTVSVERREQVLAVLEQARSRDLKVFIGLGVYSWGFDEIIAEHLELDGGSPLNMCAARPESWEWMQRVLEFVMDGYHPDGLSLQSSDQGRCPCDACQELSSLEYHAAINERVCAYVKGRWPGTLLQISTWGMDLSDPEALAYIRQMTSCADVLNDYNNSAGRRGREHRRRLISCLSCAYGTEQGWWLDPPPFWDRLRWFLPFSTCNVAYWQELLEDGGNAIERYILPLVNPGAEVGFIFDGLMLQDLRQDALRVLGKALEVVFEPKSAGALEVLISIWQGVQDAYLKGAREGKEPQAIGLNRVHYSGVLPARGLAERPEYLLRLKPEALGRYISALLEAQQSLTRVRGHLGRPDKAVRLERAIGLALSDALGVRSHKAPVR